MPRRGFLEDLCRLAADRGLVVELHADHHRLTVLRIARPDGLMEETQPVGSHPEIAARALFERVRAG